MLGQPLPPKELFTVDISRIPPAYFAESIQALSFSTWEASCCVVFIFEKDFLSAPFTRIWERVSFILVYWNDWRHRFITRESSSTTAQEIAAMRKGRQANVLSALIRREINCGRTNDHNLLLSYGEDSSVMSCYRSKVRFFFALVILPVTVDWRNVVVFMSIFTSCWRLCDVFSVSLSKYKSLWPNLIISLYSDFQNDLFCVPSFLHVHHIFWQSFPAFFTI